MNTATESTTASENSMPVGAPAQPQEKHERRKGKIARLPKVTRDQINLLIDDGVPYLQIIDDLGLAAHGINEMSMSRWKNGGYLDWLQEMRLVGAVEAKYELALSIVERSGQGNDAGQAVLQVIATNICRFLIETDPATLRESLLSDADKFTRFVNSMVRLAEGGVKCAVHRFRQEDRLAIAAAATKPSQNGVTEQSLLTAEDKLKLM